jgi:Na+/H+ antiporter NhaD/arsenite permease-like protein
MDLGVPDHTALTDATPVALGVPVLLLLFGATLVGVLVFHRRALEVALGGLGLIVWVSVGQAHFSLSTHLAHEWVKLANLLGLMVGFAQLAEHFERSGVPDSLVHVLPKGARGCFALLGLVWLLSGVVDNIAAAMIGATAASRVFNGRLHLGYLAAIVACANAGGAGSVIGDTTTTMIWLEGVSPLRILPAYTGAAVALVVCGAAASIQQDRHVVADFGRVERHAIDRARIAIVFVALLTMVGVNILGSAVLGARAERLPLMAIALWTVILFSGPLRAPRWNIIPPALKSGVFLVALVLAASLMPLRGLPAPSAATTLGLGFVSAIFDNIPLTKVALRQGGYDWALLAYAVGVGGSMLWFGSSAGVAVSSAFPSSRSAWRWARSGWHVPLAFLLGYLAQRAIHGWNP